MIYNGIYNQPNGLHDYLREEDAHSGHGYDHWERVVQNGLVLGRVLGSDLLVVSLFGWLHDCRRENPHDDPLHGRRASLLAASLNDVIYSLDDTQSGQLMYALEWHDKGFTDPCPTVGVCWDADRLDLCRVGIVPSPEFMSTDLGRAAATQLQERFPDGYVE